MTQIWFPSHCECQIEYKDNKLGQTSDNVSKILVKCKYHENTSDEIKHHDIVWGESYHISLHSAILSELGLQSDGYYYDEKRILHVKVRGLTQENHNKILDAKKKITVSIKHPIKIDMDKIVFDDI